MRKQSRLNEGLNLLLHLPASCMVCCAMTHMLSTGRSVNIADIYHHSDMITLLGMFKCTR